MDEQSTSWKFAKNSTDEGVPSGAFSFGDAVNSEGIPFSMRILHDGEDLLRQPVPERFISYWNFQEELEIVPASLSLESAIISLIFETQRICSKDQFNFLGIHGWTRLDDFRHLLYQGIEYFSVNDLISQSYPSVSNFVNFRQLFSKSREEDYCWKNYVNSLSKMGIKTKCDSNSDTSDALQDYAKRKLDTPAPITTLDCHVFANAFNADLYIYYSSSNAWKETAGFTLFSRSEYNYECKDSDKRPKWILVIDMMSGTWYPIVSEIKPSMQYLYREDVWASKLIYETEDYPVLK